MKMTASKEVRKLMKLAERAGWEFENRTNHIMGKHSDGKRTTTISRSASDHRALMNIKKDLGV